MFQRRGECGRVKKRLYMKVKKKLQETYLNFAYLNFEDVYGGMAGLDQTELGLMDSIYRGMRVGTECILEGDWMITVLV